MSNVSLIITLKSLNEIPLTTPLPACKIALSLWKSRYRSFGCHPENCCRYKYFRKIKTTPPPFCA